MRGAWGVQLLFMYPDIVVALSIIRKNHGDREWGGSHVSGVGRILIRGNRRQTPPPVTAPRAQRMRPRSLGADPAAGKTIRFVLLVCYGVPTATSQWCCGQRRSASFVSPLAVRSSTLVYRIGSQDGRKHSAGTCQLRTHTRVGFEAGIRYRHVNACFTLVGSG